MYLSINVRCIRRERETVGCTSHDIKGVAPITLWWRPGLLQLMYCLAVIKPYISFSFFLVKLFFSYHKLAVFQICRISFHSFFFQYSLKQFSLFQNCFSIVLYDIYIFEILPEFLYIIFLQCIYKRKQNRSQLFTWVSLVDAMNLFMNLYFFIEYIFASCINPEVVSSTSFNQKIIMLFCFLFIPL